ncbi:hypothetical protein K435DRAFT_973740 [Dendrothele bispora CBS 962.96]|uniref:DASH complex subunit SPC19 n=1 Tax=Dendrothele bispora (strain CBS 962.96) TaxID=1314807 RepID=A0A4S8KQA9_DENBC|nr:hypothetical protein K435DRAFT_973740 [Dendrothele bispora CBS 962.96]
MSRLSRANLKARDSIFVRGPELHRGDIQVCPPDLEECVRGLEDCCEEAHEIQQLVRNGTRDFQRTTRVLQSERVFELVNETTIKTYQSQLTEHVEPAVSDLMERAEAGLKVLQKKESQLQAKVEAAQARPLRPTSGTTMAAQKLEQRRLHMLTKQREQLESELEALQDEVADLESGARF